MEDVEEEEEDDDDDRDDDEYMWFNREIDGST